MSGVVGVILAGGRGVRMGPLGRVFPKKSHHLKQSYALTLYWLFSRILQTYEIPENQHERIRESFKSLDLARLEAQARDYGQPGDDLHEDLSLAMSRGHTGVEGLTTRHNIVGPRLFDGVELVERPDLDERRNFTHEEKLILYQRSRGCCQLELADQSCGRALLFDDAVVDHIVPHSTGGRTELANGRIAFKLCNIARGARNDFDPATQCHLEKAQEEPAG